MGWLSKLLLPGRLRTGPTVLLPARPDHKTLLAIAQLADPEAAIDGDDVIAGGSRISSAIELTGDILGKLGVPGEERLWACRVTAEGPLPVDYFDKSLAEGIAHRLGGWCLCRGEVIDPAEGRGRDLLVYLPAVPEPQDVIALLRELIRPIDSLDTGRWPGGELIDGIVHVPVRRATVADVYAGADIVVTVEEGRKIPPAARARWPYLTEIVVVSVSRLDPARTPDSEDAQDPAATEDAPAGGRDGSAGESRDGHGDAADASGDDRAVGDDEGAVAGGEHGAGPVGGEPSATAAPDASDEGGETEDALLARAAVALVMAGRLQGIATDQASFQFAEPADVLAGRYA